MIKTTPSRYPHRGVQSKEVVYNIIDKGLYCTVAFIRDQIPHQIPTGFCRVKDQLYIHASNKSGFINGIINQKVSFSITHLDGLVLAPTAFDHSFNYHSVIGFCTAKEIIDEKKKLSILTTFTERYIAGRIADVGVPKSDEVAATKIIALSLDNAGAKIREGGVGSKKLSTDMPWSGIIPIVQSYGTPQIDNDMKGKLLPNYIKNLIIPQ